MIKIFTSPIIQARNQSELEFVIEDYMELFMAAGWNSGDVLCIHFTRRKQRIFLNVASPLI